MQVGKAPMLLVDGQPVIRDVACHAATSIISRLAQIASVRSQGEYAVMDAAREPQSICLCSSEATTCFCSRNPGSV
ncbi:hypothetical protein WJX79_004516 [Trebouxia sp. C0005]